MRLLRIVLLLTFSTSAWGIEGYVLGGGIESDSGDGVAGAIVVDLGITDHTWISGSAGISSVDLPNGTSFNTQTLGVSIDHWFEPLGATLEIGYWGDDDVLDSVDLRGSLYWRNDRFTIAADYEVRDFDFNIAGTDISPDRQFEFDSTGVGVSARLKLTEAFSVNVSGIDYEYNVNLALDSNRRISDLISVSRLSLVNSLIDYRVGAGLSLDVGDRNWSLDYRVWEGAVNNSKTNSTTLRFLTPLGQRGDVEFGLGVDNSDRFGSVSFLSVFLYFYGSP